MGICAEELREFVIRPTLQHLGHPSAATENLLLGTAARQSGLGFHLANRNNTGLGIYQIMPQTHVHLWDNYLVQDPELASRVRGLASQHEFLAHPHAELATNLSYATAIAWLNYRQHNQPLSDNASLQCLADYWLTYWQTDRGDTAESFVDSYQCCISAVAGARCITQQNKPLRVSAA